MPLLLSRPKPPRKAQSRNQLREASAEEASQKGTSSDEEDDEDTADDEDEEEEDTADDEEEEESDGGSARGRKIAPPVIQAIHAERWSYDDESPQRQYQLLWSDGPCLFAERGGC